MLDDTKGHLFCKTIFHVTRVHTCVRLVSCLAQSIEELEKEMLNGQKLQGPATAAEVYLILKHRNLIDK